MFDYGSNNTNKLSPQELYYASVLSDKVQIIQINLALKNSDSVGNTRAYVQIIQINLALKNGAFNNTEEQFVQIIQINLALKNVYLKFTES